MGNKAQIPQEVIIAKMHFIRGLNVLLDSDLADLYEVETKQLKRQVRRNIERFPSDFMFELNDKEFDDLRSQFGSSSWGGTRYAPMAFTEHGVLMLSSVLNSKRAIDVNIQIMRIFVRLRAMLADSFNLKLEIEAIKKQLSSQGSHIEQVFRYLDRLIEPEKSPRQKIGYKKR